MELEKALLSGEPNRRIASRVGCSEAAIRRHRATHLPAALVKAQAVREERHANTLRGLLEEVREGLRDAIATARREGDTRATIAALKALGDTLDLALRVEEHENRGGGEPKTVADLFRMMGQQERARAAAQSIQRGDDPSIGGR